MRVAGTWAELKALTEEELIAKHDACARNTSEFLLTMRDELHHREQAKQTETVVRLTRIMAILTAVILAATILNVVLWACQ
jgi:hypothetical protein